MGTWSGRISLLAGVSDDFEVIFGLETLVMARAAVVPHLGVVTIFDESCPHMVPIEHKGKGKMLFTLQLKTRLQQGQATHLATLVLSESKGVSVPLVVGELLKKYVGVVPPELPNSLPPRREVDH
ncbi:hypothetical protein AMTR_s00085p00164010 [Amborella trichopoda]|uniref:Uncharacterized protein n=1 Tax=Amborella trichopoda TaxID=13333 RepID=W1P487_AMBTC|nr:hypothetical protein AMTR_s00085p00164010 [Amborella trichopoda]